MNDLLTEITSERHYLLQPAAFNAYRRNIMRGEDAKRGVREEKRRSVARFDAGQLVTDCHRLTDFRAYDDEWDEDGDIQSHINRKPVSDWVVTLHAKKYNPLNVFKLGKTGYYVTMW